MIQHNEAAEREAFERVARDRGWDTESRHECPEAGNPYADFETNWAYQGWQAARQQQPIKSDGHGVYHATFGTVFCADGDSARKVAELMKVQSPYAADVRLVSIMEQDGRWCSDALPKQQPAGDVVEREQRLLWAMATYTKAMPPTTLRKAVSIITPFCVWLANEQAALATVPQQDKAVVDALREENAQLKKLLNTPELHDFIKAVPLEAAHQRARWGEAHDAGKEQPDWFWLVGYVAGKALSAWKNGDSKKLKHHITTTAAVCANWHASILEEEALLALQEQGR